MAETISKSTKKYLEKMIKSVLREMVDENSKKNKSMDTDKPTPSGYVSGFGDPTECEPLTYDYLFDRHKGLSKEYFELTDIPYDPNEIAMYTIPLEYDGENCLEEGLIKTYPTAKALEYVCNTLTQKGYPITPKQFQINTPNDDKTIYGHITLMVLLSYLNKEIDTVLKQGFNACGYHLGATFNRVDVHGNPCVVYQFEPKFQTNQTNTTLGQYLFHVTTANAANKIMQQGFCPSFRGKKEFKYDARCYFFTVYDKPLFAHYMKEAGKRNRISKNSFNNDFKIITIDRNKCDKITFYTDPNFSKNIAVFTYDNVPPSAIIRCEDL